MRARRHVVYLNLQKKMVDILTQKNASAGTLLAQRPAEPLPALGPIDVPMLPSFTAPSELIDANII